MNLFDIENVIKELSKLEEKTLNPDFWNNSTDSKEILSKIKELKDKKENYQAVELLLNNTIELASLVELEQDLSMVKDILKDTNKIEKNIEKLEINTLLSGKYDSNNAILTIHPGARWNRGSRLG